MAGGDACPQEFEQRRYEMIGTYDAAVVDEENGKLHIVKRMHRPGVRIIPEALGTLPGKELKDAAGELTADHAGLIAVSEPIVEMGIDKALTDAYAMAKRAVDADAIISELQEALKY